MIQKFYGLEQDAFSLSPDLDFLFMSRSHEEAVAHLLYGLEHNEDIILICGDIGTGKTLALHRLVEQISESFVPVLITVTTLDFGQLLRLILMKLGVDVVNFSGDAELIFAFEKALIDNRQRGKKVLLIIDECQNLPLEALESIRLLMNLGQPGGQALQLVLAGQLGLRANLENPNMRQLKQRIRVDYQIELLSREELAAYITHRLEVAGRIKPLFKNDAIDKIHRLSKGVPRVVNHLASKALLSGFIEGAGMISAKYVEDIASGAPTDHYTPVSTRTVHPEAPAPAIDVPELDLDAEEVAMLVNKFEDMPAEPVRQVQPEQPEGGPQFTPAPASDPGRKSRKTGWVAAVLTYSRGLPILGDLIEGAITQTEAIQQASPSPVQVEPTVEMSVNEVPDVAEESTEDFSELTQSDPGKPAEATRVPEELNLDRTWLIHVASFRQSDGAQNFTNRLVKKGVEAEFRSIVSERGETWYRVYVGPFLDRSEANQAAYTMKENGVIDFSRVTRY
jgi:general secretion pathway protein A